MRLYPRSPTPGPQPAVPSVGSFGAHPGGLPLPRGLPEGRGTLQDRPCGLTARANPHHPTSARASPRATPSSPSSSTAWTRRSSRRPSSRSFPGRTWGRSWCTSGEAAGGKVPRSGWWRSWPWAALGPLPQMNRRTNPAQAKAEGLKGKVVPKGGVPLRPEGEPGRAIGVGPGGVQGHRGEAASRRDRGGAEPGAGWGGVDLPGLGLPLLAGYGPFPGAGRWCGWSGRWCARGRGRGGAR